MCLTIKHYINCIMISANKVIYDFGMSCISIILNIRKAGPLDSMKYAVLI